MSDSTTHPVISAMKLVREGRVFDLDPGRWPGMPMFPGHAQFQVLTYRTPAGIKAQGDQAWLAREGNHPNISFISDMVMGTTHVGAHMDALAHITCGEDNHWHGGVTAAEALGDFGPTIHDAAALPTVIGRGVLVDVAGHLGRDRLPAGHPVSAAEIDGALQDQGVEIHSGDTVLVRTGQMSVWPHHEKLAETAGSGLSLDGADRILELGGQMIGTDTESVEAQPSTDPTNPHPVHQRLLIERGVHILENIYLEDLAEARAYEFLFIALPPRISGATASMLRPVAVI